MNRYKHHDEPITEEMARNIRQEQIDNQLDELEHRNDQITDCLKQLKALREMPLDTTVRIQTTLFPGDDGYDEAPALFDPEYYLGDSKWVNIPKP